MVDMVQCQALSTCLSLMGLGRIYPFQGPILRARIHRLCSVPTPSPYLGPDLEHLRVHPLKPDHHALVNSLPDCLPPAVVPLAEVIKPVQPITSRCQTHSTERQAPPCPTGPNPTWSNGTFSASIFPLLAFDSCLMMSMVRLNPPPMSTCNVPSPP